MSYFFGGKGTTEKIMMLSNIHIFYFDLDAIRRNRLFVAPQDLINNIF
jgi:hypothetical protein